MRTGLEAGVQHVPEVVLDPVGDAAPGSLAVGELDLLLGDGDSVDVAAEALVGHDGRAAATAARVEQVIVGLDVAEVVEQDIGLRGLQPVQFGDDRLVADVGRGVEYGRVVVTDAVVVVVQAVHIAEPQVDRVFFVVPVRRDRTLVGIAQHGMLDSGHCCGSFCGWRDDTRGRNVKWGK